MAIVRHPSQRGFTLVELLTVVTIVGILSAVAVALVSKHVNTSRTGEALAVVQSIRAAQESYRAENRRYLSVSKDLGDYYPADKPDNMKRPFYRNGSEELDLKWNILHPVVSGPVRFVYATVAYDPGAEMPDLGIRNPPTFAVQQEPFYVIRAVADMDSDNQLCMVVATSVSPETYVQDEGE